MTGGPGLVRGTAAVCRGQLSRARAARGSLLFVATLQSVGLLVLLRGVAGSGSRLRADTTGEQVVAGCTVLVVGYVALNLLAQHLGRLRGAGLAYYAALPVPPAAVVLGTAAAYAAFTVPGAVLTALLGVALYGLPLAHLWLLVLVLPLGATALAGLGGCLGLLAPRSELATALGQLGMTAVLFLGIIPGSRLPAVLRPLRALFPGTAAADALAGGLRAAPPWGALSGELALCAALAVVLLAAASLAFRRAVASAR